MKDYFGLYSLLFLGFLLFYYVADSWGITKEAAKKANWWAGAFVAIAFLDWFRRMPRDVSNQYIDIFVGLYAFFAVLGFGEYIYKRWLKRHDVPK